MTAEQSFFLALLRDHVQGSVQAPVPENMDCEALLAIARDQSLQGIIYAQIKALRKNGAEIPEEVFERFHKAFHNEVWEAANQRAYLAKVSRALDEAGIEHIPFKGCVVRQSWPVPELRTMGDLDILIRQRDVEAADRLMRSLGFARSRDSNEVWSYTLDGLMFEMHNRMFYEHLGNDVDYPAYFDAAWEHADPSLEPDFHLLYLIAHLAKHTVNKGMGFRGFLDLVFFAREQCDQLHWDKICRELEKLKLLRFTESCYAFCRAWFGAEPPIPVKELAPAFYTSVTEKMFRDGTFGLENEQNAGARAAKEISHSGGSYWLGAVKLTLRRIFPAYEDMNIVPRYAFLDGRPWLLPAAWVYRWVYVLGHKRKQGKALLLEPYEKKAVVEKRQQYIRDWGI